MLYLFLIIWINTNKKYIHNGFKTPSGGYNICFAYESINCIRTAEDRWEDTGRYTRIIFIFSFTCITKPCLPLSPTNAHYCHLNQSSVFKKWIPKSFQIHCSIKWIVSCIKTKYLRRREALHSKLEQNGLRTYPTHPYCYCVTVLLATDIRLTP
jgi:hypothetical protein